MARTDRGNRCATGTAGAGCRSITIPTTILPARFKVLVSCDDVIGPGGNAGSVCPIRRVRYNPHER